METYEPVNLKLWTHPDNYAGECWPATYSAGVGQSRDSSALERSNFTCMLRALGGESETVTVVREGHWAVGWVEWIAIHQDDSVALKIADEIAGALEDYPVINDDHFGELEFNEMLDRWADMSFRDRADTIMDEVRRYHRLKPSLMRFRRLLRSDYSPGMEDGLSDDEVTVSLALEETMRHA